MGINRRRARAKASKTQGKSPANVMPAAKTHDTPSNSAARSTPVSTPPSVQATRQRIQAICSVCGQVFAANPSLDRNQWECPYCDRTPSPVPHHIDTPTTMQRWQRLVRSHINVPIVQVGAVLLSFGLFLTGISIYLSLNPAAVYVGGKSSSEIAFLMRGIAPEDAQHAQSLAAANARADDNTRESRPDTMRPPRSTKSRSTSVAVYNASHRTAPATASGETLTSRDGALSILDFIRFAPYLYGEELRLPCRIVSLDQDVAGLPNHFKMNGETVRLPSAEEAGYLRLVITDDTNEEFRNVFIERWRTGQDITECLNPGDWLMLHGTPGMRYDRQSETTAWGFVVTNVSELGTTTETAPATSSPPFVPPASRPEIPSSD